MEIGTIGAGDFAQAFAKRALKAGHKVKLSNNRVVLTLHAIARYNVAFLVTRLKKTGGESGIRLPPSSASADEYYTSVIIACVCARYNRVRS